MRNFLTEKVRVVIISLIMIAVGITFCVIPEKSLDTIELVLAIGLIVVGLVYILGFCFAPDYAKESKVLMIGVLSSALGVLIIFVPSTLVLGIGIIYGYAGLGRIGLSIDEKQYGDKSWWIELVSGIVVFAFGLSLIVLRTTTLIENIIMIYMGACLIVFGVLNLVLLFVLKRETEKFKKMIKENFSARTLKQEAYASSDENSNDDGSNPDNFTDFEVK